MRSIGLHCNSKSFDVAHQAHSDLKLSSYCKLKGVLNHNVHDVVRFRFVKKLETCKDEEVFKIDSFDRQQLISFRVTFAAGKGQDSNGFLDYFQVLL